MSTSGTPAPREAASLGSRVAHLATHVPSDLPLVLIDAALIAASYAGAMVLRFNYRVPSESWQSFRGYLLAILAVHLGLNAGWRLYGQLWRHASILEARRVLGAGATAVVILFGLTAQIDPRPAPLSVVALGGVVATILMGVSRFQSRLFAFRRNDMGPQRTRVVVVGAGSAGATIVQDMQLDPSSRMAPVAVLDDDPRLIGRRLHGIRIEGNLAALPDIVAHHRADLVVLAIADAPSELVRRVSAASESADVPLNVVPRTTELLDGRVSLSDVRDLQIEDLLGRQEVHTDLVATGALLRDRVVLITGGGGSIGSEIARQVAAFDPLEVHLLDHDETHLHDASAAIRGAPTREVLADIRDRALMERIFREIRPDIVFHAAAHKHVPILEQHPGEAVLTNVIGTRNVVEAAQAIGVERFVLISTDKAVCPTSVMGASKAVAEQIVLDAAKHGENYCAVRFGNVLGSRGSVIPTFMRQIREGGPITVTDARMTRYFMSMHEAVQLVLEAAALAEGPGLYMLEMGEPVTIMELAERMIRLAGKRVGKDVEIRVTGVRSGEKLNERLHDTFEAVEPTSHPSVVSVRPASAEPGRLRDAVVRLHERARSDHVQDIRAELFRVIQELRPAIPDEHTIIDLDLITPQLPGSTSWSPSTTSGS